MNVSMSPSNTALCEPTILLVEDDFGDRMLTMEAGEAAGLPGAMKFLEDGVELLAYLLREGAFAGMRDGPRPVLVLLDLKMPRMSGTEVLAVMKEDPYLKAIPVLVLTTSTSEEDVERCYRLGANCYIPKPATFQELVAIMGRIRDFWLGLAALPRH